MNRTPAAATKAGRKARPLSTPPRVFTMTKRSKFDLAHQRFRRSLESQRQIAVDGARRESAGNASRPHGGASLARSSTMGMAL